MSQEEPPNPTILSPKEFLSIGATISKYTNPLDKNIEEREIGITIPTDEDGTSSDPCQLLEPASTYEILTDRTLNLPYFQDGIQRTQFLGNIFSEKLKRLVPIIFMTVGAIVVCVEGGHVRKYLDPILEERFIMPDRQYLPAELTANIAEPYLYEVKDLDPLTVSPNELPIPSSLKSIRVSRLKAGWEGSSRPFHVSVREPMGRNDCLASLLSSRVYGISLQLVRSSSWGVEPLLLYRLSKPIQYPLCLKDW
jgi:hypothetical protein